MTEEVGGAGGGGGEVYWIFFVSYILLLGMDDLFCERLADCGDGLEGDLSGKMKLENYTKMGIG